MIWLWSHIARILRRFRWSETGSATVEFAILFPPFMMIFMSACESGLMMLRTAMVERALDISVRELRIGAPTIPTHAEMRQNLCEISGMLIPNCLENMQLELQLVDSDTWQPMDATPRCVNRDSPIDPFEDPSEFYNTGENNDFMLIRVCANVDPIFPSIQLGLILDGDGSNGYAIVAMSAFVNEPSR